MAFLKCGCVLLLALVHRICAQCLFNEFTIDEELQTGSVVGNLFERNASRALQCLVGLLQSNESIDYSGPVDRTLLSVVKHLGQPVMREERFAFRDGNLVVAQRINRESLCPNRAFCLIEFQLSFVPPSGGNRVVFPVSITVRDKDDNKPFWQTTQAEIFFYEQPDLKRKEFFGRVVDLDAVQENFTMLRFDLYDPSNTFELLVSQAGTMDEDKHSYDVFLGVKSGAQLDRESRKSYVLHTCVSQQRSRLSSQLFVVESQARSIPLIAQRSPLNDCVTMNVTILDDNDNPPIVNSVVRLNVSERWPLNRTVFRFNATDLDEGINAELRFRFAASQSDRETFAVDDSGELTIRRKLDFETTTHHVLKIDVFDSSSKPQTSTIEVLVTVLDENDEFPSIQVDPSSSNPLVSVSEHSDADEEFASADTRTDQGDNQLTSKNVTLFLPENTTGELVELTVRDRDSNENGRVSCRMLERSPRQLRFRPIASGLNFVVDLVTPLDAENEQHSSLSFAIECTDGGRRPLRTVLNARLALLDVNDNPPRFSVAQVNASVDENAAPNTLVVQMHAEDADRYENGAISYRMLNPLLVPFKIDEPSGEITTRAMLDRETVDMYTLYVVATDGGNRSLSSTATVSIHVLDVNDQVPRFDRALYTFHVSEELADNTRIGFVNASDRDTAENARLTYSLDCDSTPFEVHQEMQQGAALGQRVQHTRRQLPFAVDSFTGELTTLGRLDRETRPSYTFRVCAIDGGFPAKMGYAYVTVTVQDVNDNSPIWLFPNATHFIVNVTQVLPIGSTVTTVRAHDVDMFENGSIIYSITHGNQDKLFELDPLDGTLLIVRQLQPTDLSHVHRLQLEASDRPLIGNARKAIQQIVIIVAIENSQLELTRRNEQPLSDFALMLVLVIGTVTMLLTVFLIVMCVCLVQKKRQRETRRKRRRRNDHSNSVSRSSSKHTLSHAVFKTHSNSPLNDVHASLNDRCRSKPSSMPAYEESEQYYIDRVSEDRKSEINEDGGLRKNSTVCKFYDDGKHYDSRTSTDDPTFEQAFMDRLVSSMSPMKPAHDFLTQNIDKEQSLTLDMNRSFPSVSTSKIRGQQRISSCTQKTQRLTTFAIDKQWRTTHNEQKRGVDANTDVLTPQSDKGPSLDSIHNQFLQCNQSGAQRSHAGEAVDHSMNRSVHTTPVKQFGRVKQRRGNSKPNIYSCLSHNAAPSHFRNEHRMESSDSASRSVNFTLHGLARPSIIDISPHSCAAGPINNTQQSAQNAICSSPLKHSVSPITIYMARSPTTPCIDEYRPAQSATAPSSRTIETASDVNDNDSSNNDSHNSNAGIGTSNTASKPTLSCSIASKTQTTFV